MKKPNRDQQLRVTLYEPSGRGGVCHYTYFLAEGLARAGCRVTLLTSHDYELSDLPRKFDLVALFRPSWLRTIVSTMRGVGTLLAPRASASDRVSVAPRASAGPKELLELKWLRRVRLRLRLLLAAARMLATRSRILHVQWYSDRREDLRFLRLLKRLGVRTLYTAHDVLPHEGLRPGDQEMFTKLYRAVDQIIVLTESTRREIVEAFDVAADRVSVIPHGGDSLLFPAPSQESARAALGIAPDRRVILFFGLIQRYKGLEYLAEAFDAVGKEVEEAFLLVAGSVSRSDPAGFDYYSSLLADLRVRRDVVCAAEYIAMSRVGMYFAAADVVVLPYVRTHHSGVLFMAYASGKPVIVTDTGGLAEDVEEGQTGFVVPPKDANALADRIVAVLTLPDRGRAMGQRAQELSKTTYSWSAVGEKTAALYRRLLEPDRGARHEGASNPEDPSAPPAERTVDVSAETRSF